MRPPPWINETIQQRIASRCGDIVVAALEISPMPTAVAVTTLDISQPANKLGADYYAHWGLTHFLLDGHHKLHAAAQSQRPLRLLSLLLLSDASLATPEQVARVPELLASQPKQRPKQRPNST